MTLIRENQNATTTGTNGSHGDMGIDSLAVFLIILSIVISGMIGMIVMIRFHYRSLRNIHRIAPMDEESGSMIDGVIDINDIDMMNFSTAGTLSISVSNSSISTAVGFIENTIELIRTEHMERVQLICAQCLRPFDLDPLTRRPFYATPPGCDHFYHPECLEQGCLITECRDPKLLLPKLVQRRPGYSTPPSLRIRRITQENTYSIPAQSDMVPKFDQTQWFDVLTWHKLRVLQHIYGSNLRIDVKIVIVNTSVSRWIIEADTVALDEDTESPIDGSIPSSITSTQSEPCIFPPPNTPRPVARLIQEV